MTTTNDKAWSTQYSLEMAATPEAVWALFRDVPGWTRWNPGVEAIAMEGPFAAGTWFAMTVPGGDVIRTRIVEAREGELYVDETSVGELTIKVVHRIERLGPARSRVTYAVEAVGPGAEEVGPAVSADFPQVLEGLAAAAGAVG
jgi:carbon monoxide dehydrogenase subunit G